MNKDKDRFAIQKQNRDRFIMQDFDELILIKRGMKKNRQDKKEKQKIKNDN